MATSTQSLKAFSQFCDLLLHHVAYVVAEAGPGTPIAVANLRLGDERFAVEVRRHLRLVLLQAFIVNRKRTLFLLNYRNGELLLVNELVTSVIDGIVAAAAEKKVA